MRNNIVVPLSERCLILVSFATLLFGCGVRAAALNNKFQSVQFVVHNSVETSNDDYGDQFVPDVHDETVESSSAQIIADDIFWGDLIESSYPKGFGAENYTEWMDYVNKERAPVVQLEQDKCGRMQNRLVSFADGTTACGRYRQNMDQIQGEMFSFYFGQLLNLTNLVPTALHIVDEERDFWSNATAYLREAEWKKQRPVVLTKHIPGLVPASIPAHYQKPLELNKFDAKNINITLSMKNSLFDSNEEDEQGELRVDSDGVGAAAAGVGLALGNSKADKAAAATLSSSSKILSSINLFNARGTGAHPHPPLGYLIELAQWSDLIVFDYIIAHLDRVVNNLFNYQWNSQIMEAPAHNLAKTGNLLLFLDNESGLLHGYRLLSKYQAYHSLLLKNLCVFRRSTINQVRNGGGQFRPCEL